MTFSTTDTNRASYLLARGVKLAKVETGERYVTFHFRNEGNIADLLTDFVNNEQIGSADLANAMTAIRRIISVSKRAQCQDGPSS